MARHGGKDGDGKTPVDGDSPQGGKRGSGESTKDNKDDGKPSK
ncbi:hypothetical protein [Actinomadura macrotermitis]|uniref:Uncharacterized protein n=1 Tax=Actinomadura macrotermitis TaxID=2585200 RepID=A0A7K0C290_9ACTN|nr:hypothetical protein [Actinomadura macrotermitis]MQY07496.1 hypothetical protein [Actinomadura macrotermitis]